MKEIIKKRQNISSLIEISRNRLKSVNSIAQLPKGFENLNIGVGKKKKSEKFQILVSQFFNEISKDLEELLFVRLVAQFEFEAYKELKRTTDSFKNKVQELEGPYSFKFSRDELITNPAGGTGLGLIKSLLKQRISDTLYKNLVAVVNMRDYYAHGKRYAPPQKVDFDFASEILEEVLTFIKCDT